MKMPEVAFPLKMDAKVQEQLRLLACSEPANGKLMG